ncbi:MAG TPA: hypothetical protein VHA52_00735, partial [Candidatus Babeliaceae bacterium]|nr:hypothetical protein [Candidatus Babeliaceae bacterium]
LEEQVIALESDHAIDVVFGDYYVSYKPNQVYSPGVYDGWVKTPEFSPCLMFLCLPGPQPMWRKKLHDNYGFFAEDLYSSADLEFWNRIVSKGTLFKRLPAITGTYYLNPDGVSTTKDEKKVAQKREAEEFIVKAYGYRWNSHRDSSNILILLPTLDIDEAFIARLKHAYRMLSGSLSYAFVVVTPEEKLAGIDLEKNFPNLVVAAAHDLSMKMTSMLNYDIIIIIDNNTKPIEKDFEKKCISFFRDHVGDIENYNGSFLRDNGINAPLTIMGKKATLQLS